MSEKSNEQNDNMPIVGIDLGTTNSAVAFINAKKNPEIIPSFRGERIIPSVILIDMNEQVVIGQDAKDAQIAMPDRTLAAVKRKMGQAEELQIADKKLLPQEASALILKELKKYADAVLGEGKKEAVITVPAYFTDEQRRSTKQAGELAGFVVERIINEPTAAALAYGFDNMKKDANILVYDLGGGTFDVSIVEMMKGILEVKASAGNSSLGGEDFDWMIVDFLADYMKNKYKADPLNNIQAKSILKAEAEKIKILLSSQESVNISIPVVMVRDQKPLGIFTEIKRTQFEAMISGMLDETISSVKRVLEDSSLSISDIDHILLVGGSTAIPMVSRLLEEYFKKEPKNEINPDEAVVLGSAVQAGIKAGTLGKKKLIATDVAPFSMGVAVLKNVGYMKEKPGGFMVIIPRNTTIPTTITDQVWTSSPGQTSVRIEIYQGEDEWVKNNHMLGDFLLEGIPFNPLQHEKVNVTFSYNLNGILEVTASSDSSGKKMSVVIQDEFKRESLEDFLESVNKIEDILNQKKSVTLPEPDYDNADNIDIGDLDDMDIIDDIPSYDDITVDELLAELDDISNELADHIESLSGSRKKSIKKIMKLIERALSSKSKVLMIEAINKASDLLIELELD